MSVGQKWHFRVSVELTDRCEQPESDLEEGEQTDEDDVSVKDSRK